MLSVENLPAPPMLVMTPCGDVAGFESENSSPFSVPASHGYNFTSCEGNQLPLASSRDSPETPTNQSGLGAIIVTSVTLGWSVVTATSFRVTRFCRPMLPERLSTLRAVGGVALIAALTSL